MKIARLLMLIAFMLAVYGAARFAHGADAEPDTSPIHRIKVYGKTGAYTATAFFIDTHRLLTAAHTFKHAQQPFLIIDGQEVACRVVKVNYDKDVDCVLLETDYTSQTVCQLSSGVVIAGFPGEFKELKLQSGGGVPKVFKSDNHIIDGMSGCPLFINGVVVGMGVRHTWGNSPASCEAIPVATLRRFAGLEAPAQKP